MTDATGPGTGAAAGPNADGAPGVLPARLEPLAERLFGDRLPLARRYAELLATSGVERGLIGPREGDRLWERHILNCALLAEAIPAGTATVADVGSGAGLPGIVLAIARPELEVTLIETMLRRTTWLQEVIEELGLPVEVIRARAEDLHGQRRFDAVTARAVAALEKLSRWTLPLVADGGLLVAMKGSSAPQELEDATATLERLGGTDAEVIEVGDEAVEVPTTVVRVRVGPRPEPTGPSRGAPSSRPTRASRTRRDRAGRAAETSSDRTTSRGAHDGRRPR